MTTTTLVMTQEVAAPVERVWAAWTEPDRLARWWWPMLVDTTYDVDARVGGDYRIASAAAGFGVRGRYTALEEPHRLAMTWIWEDEDGDGPEEQVVVDLAPRGPGTLVTVTHTTEAAGADDFRQGWTDCLARLGELPDQLLA
jgi:uncharacterized protein YndB with AHSA1/START domain